MLKFQKVYILSESDPFITEESHVMNDIRLKNVTKFGLPELSYRFSNRDDPVKEKTNVNALLNKRNLAYAKR